MYTRHHQVAMHHPTMILTGIFAGAPYRPRCMMMTVLTMLKPNTQAVLLWPRCARGQTLRQRWNMMMVTWIHRSWYLMVTTDHESWSFKDLDLEKKHGKNLENAGIVDTRWFQDDSLSQSHVWKISQDPGVLCPKACPHRTFNFVKTHWLRCSSLIWFPRLWVAPAMAVAQIRRGSETKMIEPWVVLA